MTSVPTKAIEAQRTSAAISAEFVMTDADFRQISEMLHADAGIHVSSGKAALVYSRLAKRLRALGLESFRDYCELVSSHAGESANASKCSRALTTNVTRFFREPHHFEHLRKQVLPGLIEKARHGGRVRFWSAACSNGAEPYSIGLTILSMLPDAANYDIRILATDIDPNMVAEGAAGAYSDASMQPVPSDQRLRWFSAARSAGGKVWTASDALRTLVSFRQLNLIGNWPMRGQFDAIFCRNVVIYFEAETQARLWGPLRAAARAGRSPLHRPFGTRVRACRGALRERRHHHLSSETRGAQVNSQVNSQVNKTRVLVVDDSRTMRHLISQILAQDPDIEIVGQAADPLEAREAIKALQPDVVTLDVEMPNMNGIDFLSKIMTLRPTPVIMISNLTARGTEATIKALEIGAFDCIAKPAPGDRELFPDLAAKVKAAAAARLHLVKPARPSAATAPAPRQSAYESDGRIVAIGASTGGVEALIAVLSKFPENCPPDGRHPAHAGHLHQEFCRSA